MRLLPACLRRLVCSDAHLKNVPPSPFSPFPPPPGGGEKKKSHLQEFLWLPSVAPGEVDIPAGGLRCPRRDNGMGRGAGQWRGEAARRQYTQKLCRSQQHLPTVHPHAVPPSTHMLLRTKRCSADAQAHISSPPPPPQKNPPPGCCWGGWVCECVLLCFFLPFSGAPAPVEHTRVHV